MIAVDRRSVQGELELAPPSHVRLIERSAEIIAPPAEMLGQLLARIEASDRPSSVVLTTSAHEPIGSVLVSSGRPCLVSMAAPQVPLGVRLSRRWPETAMSVRRALSAAKAEQRPLGDVLLSLGSIDSDHIREALLDQIAEGFVTIASAAAAGVRETWIAASPQRVPSLLSAFAPRDVYDRAAAILAPTADDPLRRGFASLAECAGSAYLCARTSDADLAVIECRGAALLGVSDLLDISRAAALLGRPAALLAAGVEPQVTLLGGGANAVLCATSGAWTALLAGLEGSARAIALGRARRLVDELR